MRLSQLILMLLILIPLSLTASWKTMSTDSFMVYYRSGMEDEALHALKVMEHYRPQMEELTGNTHGRVAIKIEDMGNLVNGWANPVGNVIGLYAYPPTKDELAFGEDWFQIVAPHEYIHQLQMTHEGGIPAMLRRTFGNLLYPQLHQPMWMTEGITVYGESQLSPYAGRMNSAYYSSIISALAAEDRLPSRTKAAYYSQDTPLAHYYVFGGSFHSYLAKTYGEERFAYLYQDNSSRLTAYLNGLMPSLALDPAFFNAYGRSLDTLWQEWQASEKAQAKAQTATRVTHDGWDKDDLKYYDGALYFTRRYADKTGPGRSFYKLSLMMVDLTSANPQPVEVLRQATEFPASYHVLKDKIYYSRTEYRRGFANKDNDAYGSVTQIMLKDGDSIRKLFEGQVRAFLPLSDGDILIAEDKALYRGSKLYRFSPGSSAQTLLYDGDVLIHNIVMDGVDLFVNAKEYWKNSAIYSLKDGKLRQVLQSPGSQTLLQAKDGVLFYNSIIDNQMQAWEYHTKSREHRKYNYDNYLKTPVQAPDGSLYFLSLNASGMDLYRDRIRVAAAPAVKYQAEKPPFAKEEYRGQTLALGQHEIRNGGYANNIGHLLYPRILHIPQIYGTEDSLAIGAVLVGNDAVGDFPQYQIQGIYDTFRKKVIGSFMLSSTILAPVNQNLYISSDDDGTFQLDNMVFLLQRQNYGLSSVSAGFGAITWDSFERRMLYPYVMQSFAWPSGQAGLRNTLYWEDANTLSSSRDRLGWHGQLALRQRVSKHSELNSTLNMAYDPDADSDDVFYPLRGYDDELKSSKGLTLRNTWYTPLMKVRSGMWNPQIYLEDINLGLFYDAALDPENMDQSLQYSAGLELIGEFSLMFMGQMNVGLRIGTNKDKEQFIGLILGM